MEKKYLNIFLMIEKKSIVQKLLAERVIKETNHIQKLFNDFVIDEYDDAMLCRAYDNYKSPAALIHGKWDKFVEYNKKSLVEAGILGNVTEEDYKKGHRPLTSVTKLQRLHNGAIWQQYEKHNHLLEAVYDLAKEAVGEEKANAILEKHEVKRLQ